MKVRKIDMTIKEEKELQLLNRIIYFCNTALDKNSLNAKDHYLKIIKELVEENFLK